MTKPNLEYIVNLINIYKLNTDLEYLFNTPTFTLPIKSDMGSESIKSIKDIFQTVNNLLVKTEEQFRINKGDYNEDMLYVLEKAIIWLLYLNIIEDIAKNIKAFLEIKGYSFDLSKYPAPILIYSNGIMSIEWFDYNKSIIFGVQLDITGGDIIDKSSTTIQDAIFKQPNILEAITDKINLVVTVYTHTYRGSTKAKNYQDLHSSINSAFTHNRLLTTISKLTVTKIWTALSALI